jgi:ankyrin repeat protein
MKHLLLTTIAAVVLVGCGESQPTEPPKAKAPDISIDHAAIDGVIEAVKQHIAAGTDVNVKGGFLDVTPLNYAAFWGHKEVAELLIAAGADVNAKANDGTTPLDVATHPDNPNKNKAEITDLLRKHDGKHGTIYGAAGGGDVEAVKEFLDAGVDVNAKHEDGETPLHIAAEWGHKEIAELLIAKGADVNAKRDYGKTPLDLAIRRNQTKTAALLRKHGGKTGEELKAEGK